MTELQQQVEEAAADAVAAFGERADSPLDYSEASLAAVEGLLAEASDFVEEMPAERIEELVQLFGCYLLEVGRREFGGRYAWREGREQPMLVVGEPECRIAMITFDKIRGRLSGDAADNVPFFYRGFAERAREAGPGTDALYV